MASRRTTEGDRGGAFAGLRRSLGIVVGIALLAIAVPTISAPGRSVLAASSTVELTPAIAGAAKDIGPRDGVFDEVRLPGEPNDNTLIDNGFTEWALAMEFSLASLPAGAVITSANLSFHTTVFAGPRTIELHGYSGDGALAAGDFAVEQLAATATVAPGGPLNILDVTAVVSDLVTAAETHAGFAFREEPPPDPPNNTFITVFFPRLTIEFVEQPIKDPGAPYVDTNNDGLFFAADGDVLLNDGELADGVFDTDVAEGPDYTSAVQGAGLVIPASAGPFANQVGWTFSADGDLLLDTDLSSNLPFAETRLTSRHGDVVLDDPTVSAKSLVRLQALEGDVVATDDQLVSEARGQVQVIARNVDVSGSTLRGERLVSVEATSGEVRAVGSLLAAAPPGLGGEVRVEGSQIDVSHSTLKADLQVLIDAFTNRRGSVVAVGAVINHIGPTGDGPTAMQGDIGGGLGVAIYAYDDIDVSEATVHSRDVIEIASGRDTFGTGLHVLACDGGGGGHLTIGGGDSTLVPNSMLRGARGVFLSAGGFPGDRLDVSNSLIADTYDGPGDHYSFGIAPVLLGARDIDADGSTILGGAGAPVLFPFGGFVSTAGATVTPGFNSTECPDVAFGRGQRPNVDFAFDAVLGASGAVDGRASVDVGGLSFAGDIDCGSVSGDLAILGGTSDSGAVEFVLMVSDDPDGIIVGTGRPNCDTTGFGNPASLPLSNGNIFVFDH